MKKQGRKSKTLIRLVFFRVFRHQPEDCDIIRIQKMTKGEIKE